MQKQKGKQDKQYFILIIFFIIVINHSLVNCAQSQQYDQFQDFEAQYQKNLFDFQTQFNCEQYLKNMTKQAESIKFESIREKYLFIYSNHIDFCLEEIGDQFKAYVDAALMPITVKVLGIGVAKSIAVKTGVLGALKFLGIAAGGLTVLPLVGLAGAAWIYNSYKTQQLKEVCSLMMQKMQEEIQKQQNKLLAQVQQKFKAAEQKFKNIQKIEEKMHQIDKKQQKLSNDIQKTSSSAQTLSSYFQFFKLNE